MERSALSALAEILDALSIRWALIGALAANRYRVSPRLTQDVDLLLSDSARGHGALEAALAAAGWTVRRADAAGDLLRLRHPQFGIADLLISGTEYQQEALSRAKVEKLSNGPSVAVLTAEDVIIHKLIAGRSQDVADIEAIVAAGVALDDAYIDRWVAFWDVGQSWAALRKR